LVEEVLAVLQEVAVAEQRYRAVLEVLEGGTSRRWRAGSECLGLSYRDVEELLAERGMAVDHVTIYRWVQRFTLEFIEAARPRRHCPGDRWCVDETYVHTTPPSRLNDIADRMFRPRGRIAWLLFRDRGHVVAVLAPGGAT
jgi:hypothetical protein